MSCICYVCKGQESKPDHDKFVPSAFTLTSSTGNLLISSYSLSIDQGYLGFRLNRYISVHACDSIVVFPTWTIEDCLFIEVYSATTLIGLGKVLLAQCSFENPQKITDFEWFTDQIVEVEVSMDFIPAESKEPNAVAVYRETLTYEEQYRLHLKVRVNDIETDHKVQDSALALKEEVWQQVTVAGISADIEIVLVSGEAKTSLLLPKTGNMTVHTAVSIPASEGNFLALYVVPFYSYFLAESSNTIFFQMARSNNIWLDSLDEQTILSISLKSPLFSEGITNDICLPIQDIADSFDYQFTSYSPEDKLVIRCSSNNQLLGVGILKLTEIPSLPLSRAFQSCIQIGYNSCQIWLTVNPRARDQTELKAENRGNQNTILKNLTYKDPVFLDVLELLEYKIQKMQNKNQLLTTANNKILTKNEWLKKKISELERAPNLNDYKQADVKKKPRSENVVKDNYEGICACGRPNPKFKGYCEECVKKIKADYERVLNWFTPIEKKHKELEDKFININGRKILLELKIKRLEERIAKPIVVGDDQDLEAAAQMAASLKKIQEEIINLQQESESTAQIYLRQEEQIKGEIKKVENEKDAGIKGIEEMNANISKNEEQVAQAKDRLVFKQYFNEKYG